MNSSWILRWRRCAAFLACGLLALPAAAVPTTTAPATAAAPSALSAAATAGSSRTNFLLIVADDLGYSDLGSFGGEIETPNLDRLARAGLRFSSFYTTPTCSPTRAMLLTGVDSHKAGMGNMAEDIAPNQAGQDEYLGHLNTHVATIAERLRDAGYATFMSGKWHLGGEPQQSPAARGFERSFALMQGGASHYDMSGPALGSPKARYRRDGKLVEKLPAGFYSSDYYASQMLDYLRADRKGRPFFAYLAFTAPHWPLQAPEDVIRKYESRYRDGPASLHDRRLQGLVREGLLGAGVTAHPPVPAAPDWNTLSAQQRARETRKMAVFAAMVDQLDANVGRVLDYLRQAGELDRTVIVFLSDNGAEGHNLSDYPEFRDWAVKFDQRLERMGRAGSFTWYGPQWAQAGTAPSRLYKGFPTEGGIHVPAFIWSAGQQAHGINRSLVSAMDVVPTLLDLAGVASGGDEFHHHKVHPIEGRTLRPVLTSTAQAVRGENDSLGWELFGRSAVRIGQWKAVQLAQVPHAPRWELFDLAQDPAEMHDLSAARPEQARELLEVWDRYVKDNHVILPDKISGY
ncbi:MAG: arylsulfatase [Steroidobacteraceae bacterium]